MTFEKGVIVGRNLTMDEFAQRISELVVDYRPRHAVVVMWKEDPEGIDMQMFNTEPVDSDQLSVILRHWADRVEAEGNERAQ